ncbi:hypothetical protein BCR43DRAFT_84444 [Syncephalastrum racemosum]|uniref:Uncharacterized protein n=1 Tax=Syncephalastrum racemosum TaxID=13706 RepID=A0A1X2H310_SYNRA|nr:hypothetical protein BCR43DRAFT_84444 [Syncephalastrum racemosum]
MEDNTDFSYCLTRDVAIPVSIRISSLEGLRDPRHLSWKPNENLKADFYASVQLFAGMNG